MNTKLLINKNGDWGLGIGDWAPIPIPNPQSPYGKSFNSILAILIKKYLLFIIIINLIIYKNDKCAI